jgi:hypothetical protein
MKRLCIIAASVNSNALDKSDETDRLRHQNMDGG